MLMQSSIYASHEEAVDLWQILRSLLDERPSGLLALHMLKALNINKIAVIEGYAPQDSYTTSS